MVSFICVYGNEMMVSINSALMETTSIDVCINNPSVSTCMHHFLYQPFPLCVQANSD